MSGRSTCRVTSEARNAQIIDTLNRLIVLNQRIAQTEVQFDNVFHNLKFNIITRKQYEDQVEPIMSSLIADCDTLRTALEFLIELYREMN